VRWTGIATRFPPGIGEVAFFIPPGGLAIDSCCRIRYSILYLPNVILSGVSSSVNTLVAVLDYGPQAAGNSGKVASAGGRSERVRLDPRTSEARELWILMGQASHGLYRARENELRPLGIPMMHSQALWVLKVLASPATPAEISRMLSRRHQTVSQLLKRMEKQGLVQLGKSPRKPGQVTVTSTAKGEEAVRLAQEKEEVVAEILSCLSREEQDNLKGYMKRLREKALAIASMPVFP